MQWKTKVTSNQKLTELAEIMPSDIEIAIRGGELSPQEAAIFLVTTINLAEIEVGYLEYRTESDDAWFSFTASSLHFAMDRLQSLSKYSIDIIFGLGNEVVTVLSKALTNFPLPTIVE